MEKKVITLKMQCNAENACGYRMWQLGLTATILKGLFWSGQLYAKKIKHFKAIFRTIDAKEKENA